jgi:hypothetical protein
LHCGGGTLACVPTAATNESARLAANSVYFNIFNMGFSPV